MKSFYPFGALATFGLLACQQPEAELPPIQFEGDFIAYAAPEYLEVCPGTLDFAETWTSAVAVRLGIDPSDLLPTTYYFVDASGVAEQCPDQAVACIRAEGDGLAIYTSDPVSRHELVHAIHLSAWPRRPPLLQEGLAVAFDDSLPLDSPAPSSTALNQALAADESGPSVALTGAWLVRWIIERHGVDVFVDLWAAAPNPADEVGFRTEFEQQTGESLSSLVSEVGGATASRFVTCVEEVRPWDGEVWTTTSPDGCESGVVGFVGLDQVDLSRTEIVEITEPGDYEVQVDNHGGVLIVPCDSDFNLPSQVLWNQPEILYLATGRYRFETRTTDASQAPYSVQLRRSP
jgi:hypothetical protein